MHAMDAWLRSLSTTEKVIGSIALAGALGAGVWALARPKTPGPTVGGFVRGQTYMLTITTAIPRSSLGAQAQADDVAAKLAAQGFVVQMYEAAAADTQILVAGTYVGATGILASAVGLVIVRVDPTSVVSPAAPPVDYVTSRPVQLQPGVTYAGRGSLSIFEKPFVTVSAVVNDLTGRGFTNVQAWTSASALPDAWPKSERDGDVFAIATYPAGAQPKPMDIPSQVSAVWRVTA